MRHAILALLVAGCAGNIGQGVSAVDAPSNLRAVQVELRTDTSRSPLPGYLVRVVDDRGVVLTMETNAIGMTFISLPSASVRAVMIRGERTGQEWSADLKSIRLHTDGDPWRLVVEVPE